ncbi:MAG: methyltransferase [Candidatus Heimdallarchaeota archaeon]|nr:methyltransferase [Candidatus Heimdallarchaeota archaeon]MCK4254983.1 methyltransferase [Candidatus Heimdallarchaeota archaeon]
MVRYNFPEYKLELDIPEEVYFPAEDTFFLIRNLHLNENIKSVYEIGGGSGIISIFLAKNFEKASFLVSDISLTATKMIQSNCKLNEVNSQIDVVCMDKLNAIRYLSPDVIIWNPPYLPEDTETKKLPIADKLMLTGGKRGYEETYDLIIYLQSSKANTSLYTIFSSIAWDEDNFEEISEKGVHLEIIKELKLFFEKLYLVRFDFGEYDG